jgi:hypothetical protein
MLHRIPIRLGAAVAESIDVENTWLGVPEVDTASEFVDGCGRRSPACCPERRSGGSKTAPNPLQDAEMARSADLGSDRTTSLLAPLLPGCSRSDALHWILNGSDQVRRDSRPTSLRIPPVPLLDHVLVVSRGHEDLAACVHLEQEVAGRARDSLGAEGVNLLNCSGADVWQTVFHLHRRTTSNVVNP